MYYRGAAAALIVYDITDHGSFEGAQSWISELQRHGSPDIVIGLYVMALDCVVLPASSCLIT